QEIHDAPHCPAPPRIYKPMNRLRYFLLIVCLSPAILATSVDGYRQWAPNSFKERKSPAWLEKAKAPKGGPRNLMEKTLLSKGKEPPNPQPKQGIGIHRHDKNEENADSVSLRTVGLRIDR